MRYMKRGRRLTADVDRNAVGMHLAIFEVPSHLDCALHVLRVNRSIQAVGASICKSNCFGIGVDNVHARAWPKAFLVYNSDLILRRLWVYLYQGRFDRVLARIFWASRQELCALVLGIPEDAESSLGDLARHGSASRGGLNNFNELFNERVRNLSLHNDPLSAETYLTTVSKEVRDET